MMTLVDEYEIDHGYTCLAAGADQLFAQVLEAKRVPYVAVVPCRQYERAFTMRNDLREFHRLFAGATETIEMPFQEPSEQAFYEAGRKVVDCSDIVIAAWDGKPARGLGGTGDIVSYAEATRRLVVHLNPLTHIARAK
jgi:enoyl-CoA hydratase/carnithine racemase